MLNKLNHKNKIAVFEIFLMISLSFSFSYILRESLGFEYIERQENNSFVLGIYERIVKIVFNEKSIVSALDSVYTCLESKDGSICQEYFESECGDKCNGVCVPARSDDVAQCELGVCYSEDLGSCQARATKQACEINNGQWFDDEFGNIPQCMKGCCLLQGGNEAIFTTEGGCYAEAKSGGISEKNVEFRPEVNEEWACLVLAKSQEQGACVFVDNNPLEKNECRFLTKAECSQASGEFHSETLCSNPELNTRCEQQKS